MRKEPVTSNRDGSWYKQIYQDPVLPVQCIKLRTIFLICAFVTDHRETLGFFIPVLQGQGQGTPGRLGALDL